MTASPVSPVLVVVEHHDGQPTAPSTEILTLARRLAPEVVAVWLDHEPPAPHAVAELARFGANQVHAPDLDGLAPQVAAVAAEAAAAVVAEVAPGAVLLTSSFAGKEVAAGLAVLLGGGAVVDATGARWHEGRLMADKTVLAGAWDTSCAQGPGVAVVAVNPTSVTAEPITAEPITADPDAAGSDTGAPTGTPEITRVAVEFSAHARAVRVIERSAHPGTGEAGLTEARTVVVGGRGTDGDFGPVNELAEVLGGAVGATRDATDEGWIEHSAQIGQTGVTVAPALYIGLGVSGAIHHTVGMRAAGTIVAVNEDPDAPIFEMADFGVVGDLAEVVPDAVAALRRHHSG